MATNDRHPRQDNEEAVRSEQRSGDGVTLSPAEEEQVEERLPPSVQVLHEVVRIQGELEMSRSVSALAWSALAAGLSMGFSMLVPAMLQAQLPDGPAWHLVSTSGYAVGFLIVILARQQLFTENTTTAVLPLMTHPGFGTLLRLLRLWVIVMLGNLVGGALFAAATVGLPIADTATHGALHATATELVAYGPWKLFCTGIVAGWLIATMVWLLSAAEGGRMLVIIVMTWLVGVGGFAHVVVGAIEAFYLVFDGSIGIVGFVAFLLPTLAGNVIGGSLIFALISHAQVRSDDA